MQLTDVNDRNARLDPNTHFGVKYKYNSAKSNVLVFQISIQIKLSGSNSSVIVYSKIPSRIYLVILSNIKHNQIHILHYFTRHWRKPGFTQQVTCMIFSRTSQLKPAFMAIDGKKLSLMLDQQFHRLCRPIFSVQSAYY